MTLGSSGHWLGTRTGAGGTATLALFFFWMQINAPGTSDFREGEKNQILGYIIYNICYFQININFSEMGNLVCFSKYYNMKYNCSNL